MVCHTGATPGLSIKLSGLSVDENECLCSLNCTGVHTSKVGPEINNECTDIQQETADMRNVLPVNKYIHSFIKKNLVKSPSTPGLSRRRSQDFTNLRQKFIEHSGGRGGDEISARPSVTLPTQHSTFQDLPSVTTQGRGAVRKIFFSRNVTYSMAGRSDTLLARPSANSKRKWEQEELESNRKRHCGI